MEDAAEIEAPPLKTLHFPQLLTEVGFYGIDKAPLARSNTLIE